jgi:hypothetical protein
MIAETVCLSIGIRKEPAFTAVMNECPIFMHKPVQLTNGRMWYSLADVLVGVSPETFLLLLLLHRTHCNLDLSNAMCDFKPFNSLLLNA